MVALSWLQEKCELAKGNGVNVDMVRATAGSILRILQAQFQISQRLLENGIKTNNPQKKTISTYYQAESVVECEIYPTTHGWSVLSFYWLRSSNRQYAALAISMTII